MGAKSCIGEKLSLMEIKSVLAYFFIKYDYKINTNIKDIIWVQKLLYEP